MKIALIGGTGHLGRGLAIRLAMNGYDVIIGSRGLEKAKRVAEEYNSVLHKISSARVRGLANEDAAEECEIAIFAIPWRHAFSTAEKLRGKLKGKIVISPLVPMEKDGDVMRISKLPEGSAAQKLASILKDSTVICAFNNVPAERFADLNSKFDWSVAVCGDDDDAKKKVIEIINSIDGLEAFDAGPLSISSFVEGITPLLINIMLRNKKKGLGVKFS
ncbi:reduced coenzyme F420:NADP oxidoreductase [Archaeoglobus sulfaticallidus PM70-1]|uniref:Reduced coenzyme F420:NADP oxidoreductase n=1 Tax=Archaeoglobus sulfaticallidus PM70-1 TaxID=387631 RepID=N0BJZ1_9EURY|nr:NADPH-dependent F420 reductase [Archaeoglobus sulfaticallidus]AGK60450.1 reduced coenzyme F420:NADP oxidoreductase [Archaeoglobus sulfaticallidus PM70-1]